MPYWLFGGPNVYPGGGMHDLLAVGDNLAELIDRLVAHGFAPDSTGCWLFDGDTVIDWWHIVDSRTRDIVACDTHTQQHGLQHFPDTITDTSIVQEIHT